MTRAALHGSREPQGRPGGVELSTEEIVDDMMSWHTPSGDSYLGSQSAW